MSGFKELVSKFEPPAGLQRVASGDRKLLDDYEDFSSSKTPPGTPNGMHSKLEDEVAKHQATRIKLQGAEKEIRELRKLYEKLANKHKKISHLFNELKTVVDEDPPAPIPKYLRMAHLPGLEEPLTDSITPTGSPALARRTLEPTSSIPATSNATYPMPTESNATQPIPVSPSLTSAVPPPASLPTSTPPTDGETMGGRSSPSSSPSSPAQSPLISHPTTLPTSLSSGSLSNFNPSLSTMSPSDSSKQPTEKSSSPRAGRNYLTRLFSSGSSSSSSKNKDDLPKQLKAQDSWIYDRRDHIINQFLRAEKSYCSNLNVIVELFLRPLRQEVTLSSPFISLSSVQQIFSHIEVILGSSKLLVEDVQARVDNPSRPVMLGELFLKATDYFKLYTPYLSGYCHALTILSKCKADNSKFLTFIRDRERQLESEFKDLGSLLVLPVMRISQYTLFIEELLETTPEDCADCEPLKEALKKMKSVVEYVKEKTMEYESQTKVQQIQSMLTGKFQNINVPHRRYIMEGALLETSNATPRECYCFLFNDILIIAKQKKKQFEFRNSIDLLHMEVHTPQDPEGRPIFSISPVTPGSQVLVSPLSSSLSMLGSPLSPNGMPEMFMPIMDSPINSSSLSISGGLSTSSSTTSVPIGLVPSLQFYASSQRDRDNWVIALVEAIDQEKKMDKRKSKNIEIGSGSPIGSGGFINFDNSVIELQELLAQGGSGCKIHRCTIDGYTCVAKVLNVKGKSKDSIAPFISEINIIEQLRHHNIAKYLGHRFTKNSDRIWLFLEYCPFSLETILSRRKGIMFSAKDVCWIGLEIAKGIEFLHTQKNPIIHRDLKCGNILCTLNENNDIRNVKVTDFDTSKVVTKGVTLHTCVGTTAFMAPEVLDVTQTSTGYTLKADKLITLHPPFYQYESIQVAEMLLTGRRPELPAGLPHDFEPLLKFIHHCIEFDPANRPSAPHNVATLTKLLKEYTSKPRN